MSLASNPLNAWKPKMTYAAILFAAAVAVVGFVLMPTSGGTPTRPEKKIQSASRETPPPPKKPVPAAPAAAAIPSQEATAGLIASAPSQADHPQASAIYLANEERVDLDENYGYTRFVRKVIKIFNAQGREAFGQMEIVYNGKEESVEILRAATYDGQKQIPAPAEGITDVTPGDDAASKMYSSYKIKVVSMPALKDGVTIELMYRIKRPKPIVAGKFDDHFQLQSTEPMQKAEYTLTAPKHMRFKFNAVRAECAPQITEEGNRVIYRWQCSNVKELVTEQQAMPSTLEFLPRIDITNWQSWEEVGEFCAKLANSSMEINDTVRSFVSEATKGKKTQEERMIALFNAVSSKVRYVALSFGDDGYCPHPVAETIENGYGCCRDKAALLVACFAEIGVKANVVLINASTHELNADSPAPSWFNHMIVAVPVEHGFLWLDPTSGTNGFADFPSMDQNRLALVVASGASQLVKTPLASASKNLVSTVFDSQLTEEGELRGTLTWTIHGTYASGYRGVVTQMKTQERSDWMTRVVNQVIPGGLKISEVTFSGIEDLSAPLTISLKFQGEGFSQEVGDMLMVKLPEALLVNPLRPEYSAAKERKYPLVIGSTVQCSTQVSIRLPAGYQVQSLPKAVKKENAVGQYSSSYQVEGGVLKSRREFSVNVDRVAVTDYSLLKELSEVKSNDLRKQPVLRKG